MAEKTGRSSAGVDSGDDVAEKRREDRYAVPGAYQKYIELRLKSDGGLVPAVLGNFSRNGILFESPLAFSQGDHAECFLSISLLLSREISFRIEVKYCYADHGSYLTGASIDTISDEIWFDVFTEVHDFIVLRKSSG